MNFYVECGFPLLPLHGPNSEAAKADPNKLKHARLSNWQHEIQTREIEPGDNIGGRLDDLVDIDIDWGEAVAFAPSFPKTMAIGRAGQVFTHLFYKVSGEVPSHKAYKVPDTLLKRFGKDLKKHKAIIEVRSGSSHYVMLPPSIHPSGEQIEGVEGPHWGNIDMKPAEIDAFDLLNHVGFVAFMTVIKLAWPDVQSRHFGYLHTAAILRKYFYVSEAKALSVLQYVGGPDEEMKDRERAVRDTYKSDVSGISGWDALRETFGFSVREVDELKKFVVKEKKTAPIADDDFFKRFILINFGSTMEVLDTLAPEFKPMNLETFYKSWDHVPARHPYQKATIGIGRTITLDGRKIEKMGVVFENPDEYDGPAYNLAGRPFRVEPQEGDIQLWLDHIRVMYCQGNEAVYEQVLDFLADMVQAPWLRRARFGIMVHGAQRHGKSIISTMMKAILGTQLWAQPTSITALLSGFNRQYFGKVGIFAEEITFAPAKREADLLKSFLIDSLWTYEEKFMASFPARNVSRIIATTNHNHAVHLDIDDSRWLVLHVAERWDMETDVGKAAQKAYFAPISYLLDGDGPYQEWQGPGPARFLHFLLNRKINLANLERPILTKAKQEQKRLSDPGIHFLHEIAMSGMIPHDIRGTGVVCTKSAVECVLGRNTKDRHFVANAMKAVFGEKAKAMTVRTATYVKDNRLDSDGDVRDHYEPRQNGYQLPPLLEFRAIMSKVTGEDYSGDGETQWAKWWTYVDTYKPKETTEANFSDVANS